MTNMTNITNTANNANNYSLIIENVSLVGSPERYHIFIDHDGIIERIEEATDHLNTNSYPQDSAIYNGTGLIALPGFVDLHVHLREPGGEEAETIKSGSHCAAAGGFTAIFAMPNTQPVQDNSVICDYVYNKGKDYGLVDVYPIGAVTQGQKGEKLAEMALMNQGQAQVRIFSDDGHCVHDSLLMKRALQYVTTIDGCIAQHAQDPRLTIDAIAHDGAVAAQLGLTGWPRSAEEVIIARDIILADELRSRVHFCHISSAGSVALIRDAKKRGINVTAEVTPHHLLLDDSNLHNYNPIFKVNPPLREKTDIIALREAILDGTIDAIATDHAPHTMQDKACTFMDAKPGMLGLTTAAPIVAQVLHEMTGEIDWTLLSTIMSKNPARIARLNDQGRNICRQEPANLVLIDPQLPWTVDKNTLLSLSSNSPFIGNKLPISIVLTLLRGKPTHNSNSSRWKMKN